MIISSSKLVALTLLGPSLFALLMAVILEYGFGYRPCMLCIYERWPYFITLLISLRLLFLERTSTFLFYIAIVSLLSGTVITLYHIGITNHIFTVQESCSIIYNDVKNIDGLHKQLISNEIARCDAPQKLFGILLPHLNLVYSLGSVALALFVHRKNAKKSDN